MKQSLAVATALRFDTGTAFAGAVLMCAAGGIHHSFREQASEPFAVHDGRVRGIRHNWNEPSEDQPVTTRFEPRDSERQISGGGSVGEFTFGLDVHMNRPDCFCYEWIDRNADPKCAKITRLAARIQVSLYKIEVPF